MTARDLHLAPLACSLLAGGVALAVIAAVTLARGDLRPAEVPALAIEAREPAAAVHEAALEDEALEDEAPEPEAADPLDSIEPVDSIEDPADFTFAVEIGGTTYLRIAGEEHVVDDAARDDAELSRDGLVTSAVAPLSASAVPEHLRHWQGRRVLVGGTCAATVVALVEIGRVSGDPWLADNGDDRAGATWTVETAFSSGSTMIAGELDRRCPGSWARAADRPAVGLAIALDDPRLERAARRAFLASPHAEAIAADWREAKQDGAWRDHVTLRVRLVRHSITGARWAYVHAHKPGGCGEHEVNVAATYQVADDGALTEVETDGLPGRDLEDLVDLNGDGWFERLVVHADGSDRSLVAPADSTELTRIDVPLHGCGC